MYTSLRWLLLVWLWGHACLAAAVSDAPIQALGSYIEHQGTCSRELVEWNEEYGPKTMSGDTPRNFYYRVLGFKDWGPCGRTYFRPIFGELQKAWVIYSKGFVSEAEFEAKEAELINLFFASLADPAGGKLVEKYERQIAGQLINLAPPRPYSSCTYFGDQPRCME